MSRKTRKLIWSAPLVAALAVIGALALFVTLGPSQTEAQAEEVPGMPMNLTATALSPTNIELSWDPPTDGDGGTPDGYRIDHSSDGDVWYSLESSYDSTVYTDDSGLMAEETRYYRVFAFNSSGHGHVLGPVGAETEQSTKPDAVEDLDLVSTEDTITLTWTAPDDPEGAPVNMFRIQTSKNGPEFLRPGDGEDIGCLRRRFLRILAQGTAGKHQALLPGVRAELGGPERRVRLSQHPNQTRANSRCAGEPARRCEPGGPHLAVLGRAPGRW